MKRRFMKRYTIVATLAMSLAMTANAQSFRFLTFGEGSPGLEEPGMMGMGISPDGRYVCGALQMGLGYFMGDLQNDRFFYAVSEDDEGADLRHVDNNGLAIGFDGPGVTVSIDGTRTELKVPDASYKYVLGEALTDDGSILAGSLVGAGYVTYAAYCKAGGEWTMLPKIDENLLGVYKNKGTAAKYISGDGKIIAGYIGSFGPATLWVMNDKEEYEVDPLFARYAKVTLDDDKVYAGFYIQGLSNNGKYVLIQGREYDNPERAIPLVYNTETKEMTVYDEQQTGFDEGGYGITPTAICDNGMFVGVVGQIAINLGGFIMYPGETQAKMLCDAFPEWHDEFANMDVYGYHVPMGLTADGQYLIGYGYYSPDPYDELINPYFATYILGTGIGDGVEGVACDLNLKTPPAYYTIDGRKVASPGKGVTIAVTPEGRTEKIIR